MSFASVANRLLPVVFGLVVVLYALATIFIVVFGWLIFEDPFLLMWPRVVPFFAFLASLPGYVVLYLVWLDKVSDAKKRGDPPTAILQWALLPALGIAWTMCAGSFLGFRWG